MWRIYYGDGTVFSSKDGSPWDAPRQNVQVIVQSDERVGWRWISGKDYFFFDEKRGGWRETDEWHDPLISTLYPVVLFGRWMADQEWASLFARVKSELGDKQGWLMTEGDRRDG